MTDLLDISLEDTKPVQNLPRKKLLTHLDGDDYILRMDNTALENFLSCDRAAFYRLILGRTSGGTSALTYGSAIHAALEYYYTHGLDLQAMLRAGEAEFAKSPPEVGEWRNYDTFEAAIKGYLSHYGLHTQHDVFTPVIHLDQVCVERRFEDHLGEVEINAELPFSRELLVIDSEDPSPLYIRKLHIVWTGVIDILAHQGEHLWVVDHKTTSIEGPSYYDAFNLSQQFVGYTRAAQKILGVPVSGALLNCIIGRKPTKTGTSLAFSRRYYPYSKWLIDEWQSEILVLVADFVDRLRSGLFPKRTLWCTNKFGTCPYMSVCQMEPEHRLMMLNSSNYTNYVWDPLKK